MNANFGLLDPLESRVKGGRRGRRAALGARALEDGERWARELLAAAGVGAT
jgi:folate-dependent tRNA-U54 methylase TrmFO/GidA